MSYRVAVLFLILVGLPWHALAGGMSVATNGVYLVIGSWPTNQPIRFDAPLVFMPFCDTGKIELSYPLDPAYGVKIEMTDVNGKEVPKTHTGKRFGSKFDRLHNLKDTRLYPFTAAGSYSNNIGLGGARFFYDYPASGEMPALTPKDLFEINEPGKYVMEIQMQMFYLNPGSTNAWQRDLFQFPPVKIEVEKPPDKRSSEPNEGVTH